MFLIYLYLLIGYITIYVNYNYLCFVKLNKPSIRIKIFLLSLLEIKPDGACTFIISYSVQCLINYLNAHLLDYFFITGGILFVYHGLDKYLLQEYSCYTCVPDFTEIILSFIIININIILLYII